MNITIKYIGIAFIMVGCATKGVGLQPPVPLSKSGSQSCEWINSKFQNIGQHYADGESDPMYPASLVHIFSKCTSEPSCKAPKDSYEAKSVKFSFSRNDGLNIEFEAENGQLLGTAHVSSKNVLCRDNSLNLTTTSGIADDGPGAWTIAHEKRVYVLSNSAAMELVAREEISRFDVFWFGLPIVSSKVTWHVYQPK